LPINRQNATENKWLSVEKLPQIGAWVICEPWFTGSQTLGEPWVIGEP